jgi:hypothetical protein
MRPRCGRARTEAALPQPAERLWTETALLASANAKRRPPLENAADVGAAGTATHQALSHWPQQFFHRITSSAAQQESRWAQ